MPSRGTLTKWLFLSFLVIHFAEAQIQPLDSLHRILQTLPADTNRVNALTQLCFLYSSSEPQKGQTFGSQALELADDLHFPRGKAKACSCLGSVAINTGNYPQATEYILQALRLYEGLHDEFRIAACYNNLGLVYFDHQEWDLALTNYKKALASWRQQEDKSGVVRVLNNMGKVYEKKGQDAKALEMYLESMTLSEKINAKVVMGISLSNIGAIHFRQGAYAKSLLYRQKALEVFNETTNRIDQAEVYAAISETYLALSQPDKAIALAQQGLDIALPANFRKVIARLYASLAKGHALVKNYQPAYQYQAMYSSLQDSLVNAENAYNIQKFRHFYELEKEQQTIGSLHQLVASEIGRRNTFLVTLVATILIALLITNRQQLKIKMKEAEIASKKHQLELYTQSLLEKSEIIDYIGAELESLKETPSAEQERVEKINRILQQNLLTEDDWENFKRNFEEVYAGFFTALRYQADVSDAELRLSALIRLRLSLKECGLMLGISPDSVKKARFRLKKKLALQENETLEEFMGKFTSQSSAFMNTGQ